MSFFGDGLQKNTCSVKNR